MRSFEGFSSFKKVFGPTDYSTLEIELYHVENYHCKWSASFHKRCMLENNLI